MEDGQITISSPDSERLVVARFVEVLNESFSPHDLQLLGFPILECASYEYIAKFVTMYPEHCFDGAIWDEPYQSLDYGSPEITNEARATTRQRFQSLINDASWLASREAGDLASAPREELIRALMSLRMLRPDTEIE